MDDAEKKEYMENENCFIGILEDWCSRNEGVELTFFGQPDNLLDKTILDRCPTILLDGLCERDDGKTDAYQVDQPNDDRPPLLQVRDDVGDVIVHVVTCP